MGLLLVGAITLVSSNEELLSKTAAVYLVAPQSVLGKPLINQAAVINYINQKQSLWKVGSMIKYKYSKLSPNIASTREPSLLYVTF